MTGDGPKLASAGDRLTEATPPYSLPVAAVLERFQVDPDRGLDAERVRRFRREYGFNDLAEAPPVPRWKKLLAQFKDLVIWILIAAALLSGLLGEWVDALAIIAIVVLNGVLGFLQEERAEQALAQLRKLSAPVAKVLRDGLWTTIAAREVVPGDMIELEAGDNVPADARLVRAFGFRVQEASLTGESLPSDKDADAVLAPATALGDRRNMVYMGTVAAAGKATAVVVATGMATELGRIAGMLQRYEPEPTPLQRRLAELGRILIVICLAIVALVAVLQLLRGGELLHVILLAVSLAVAAVPEGLPAVVTIALALGLQRMVKRNALIRRLPSVETLGSVTVICSDKTGTLTRNEMTVRVIVVGGRRYRVTGTGYEPKGEFLIEEAGDDRDMDDSGLRPVGVGRQVSGPESDPELMLALTIGARCNNARLVPAGKGERGWRIVGDPTEGALIVAAAKAGVHAPEAPHDVIYEIPFDSERKMMSLVIRGPQGRPVMYTKGAPEVILKRCRYERVAGEEEPLTEARRRQLTEIGSRMAARALRVLALAYRNDPQSDEGVYREDDLVFVALVGMIDPPRDEVKDAVASCHQAGIRPVMITGDHPATAVAIAREIGIAAPGQTAMTGQELDATSDDQLTQRVEETPVYARVSAEHKLRVVRAWKRRGQIVAMTGDGVNDAPAVKTADIGIAMGITGTDVTKEASDMVLTDDNFASIVNAVEEGRCIFENIRKVLIYLLSCNFGEILLMLVGSLLGWPAPLLPIHLLWINLVTDGFPALALSLEPPEPGLMDRPPRPPKESILSASVGLNILWQGTLVGLVGILAFGLSYAYHAGDVERARAMTFGVIVYAELFRALAARSQRLNQFQLGVFSNPHLLLAIAISGLLQLGVIVVPFARPIFDVPPQTWAEWLAIIGLALAPVTVIEIAKLIRARLSPRSV